MERLHIANTERGCSCNWEQVVWLQGLSLSTPSGRGGHSLGCHSAVCGSLTFTFCAGSAQTLLLWETLLEAPQANLGLHLLSPYLALCPPAPRLLSICHHELFAISFPKEPEPFIRDRFRRSQWGLLFKNLWLCMSKLPSPTRWFFGGV